MTDPLPVNAFEDRFWSKVAIVDDETSCWEWQAGKLKYGYGRVRVGDKNQLTHRIAWSLIYGEIPEGICVLHHCDNPPCCNPKHLFLGSIADNNADCVAKGRHIAPCGDAHWSRQHPESRARGDKNGSRTHPEKLNPVRGAFHYYRTRPDEIRRGTAVGNAKLNDDIVREIRRLYATGAWTQEALGRKFGVGQATISLIVNRKMWTHI